MTHIIEEETGTFRPMQHAHNGYYAGDFSAVPFTSPGAGILAMPRSSTAVAGPVRAR